jgi:predicted kinase
VDVRAVYLVGGAPRTGKSSLAQRSLRADGVAWLPTDIIRTVLRRVLPDLDALDQDPVDAGLLAEYMYPHVRQAAEVCAEEAEAFLIEGFELAPWYRERLRADLEAVDVRVCFLGHETFTAADLVQYRGPKPQGEGTMSMRELEASAAWIRARSRELRLECQQSGAFYVDIARAGYETALRQARRALLG